MKKVGIVSCDKWIDKLEEDNNLKNALINLGIDAKIISWQQPLEEKHDLLVLKSVWGYQNYYKEFKNWLLYVKNNNIPLANGVDMVLNNIMKNIQFNILEKNNVDFIDTIFIDQSKLLNKNIFDMLDDKSYVFNFSQAVLIATTSACAVGSLLHKTLLFPSAIIFPFLSVITAPKGPPSLFLKP